MTRALVTGQSGFTGRHLTSHLASRGYVVSGFDRSDGGDIRDVAAIGRVVRETEPEVVFHLAAALKSADPQELYAVNVLGTVALMDALASLAAPPVVLVVSSSAVYGRTTVTKPVTERAPLRPGTHYGASKLAQELVAQRYVRAHGLRVIRARTFNVLGPGLPTTLACGAFVDAIVRLEQIDSAGPMRTGNLGSARDFTDIRDVVRAYELLAAGGRAGRAYNVASGAAVSLRHCLDVLLGLAARPIASEIDQALLQANDVEVQVGDSSRLRALTGWEPAITVDRSLADMLDHRRQEGSG